MQASHEEVRHTVTESWSPKALGGALVREHGTVEVVGPETTARFEHATLMRADDTVRVRVRDEVVGVFPVDAVVAIRASDTTDTTRSERHGHADDMAWTATGVGLGLGALVFLLLAVAPE